MMPRVEQTPSPKSPQPSGEAGRTPPGDYEATVRVLHRAPPADGVTSPPLLIRDHGMVHDQGRWQGEPYLLMGFRFPDDPEDHIGYTVDRKAWLADPQAGVGLRAEFMTIGREEVTDRVEVEAVTEQTVTLRDPWSAILRTSLSRYDPETEVVGEQVGQWDVPVGHLLDLLTPAARAEAEDVGWDNCRAAMDLDWLSTISRGPERVRMTEEAVAAIEAFDLDYDWHDWRVFGSAVGIVPPEDYQPPG